jgi:hypothetical protein
MAYYKKRQLKSVDVPRPTKWSKANQVYLGPEMYLAYIQSKQWKSKKKQYRKSGFELDCWACDSNVNIEYHHRTYGRLGWEALSDIIPLCTNCHTDLTNQYKSKPYDGPNHIWIETTAYIKDKRKSLSLFPMSEKLFNIKLIEKPHNSYHKVMGIKPEPVKKQKKHKPDYSSRKRSTGDKYEGLPVVRKIK